MPIYFMKQYHGVGISILNDKLGAYVHQRVAGQYAFRKDLWGGMLSAGVQVGMLFEKLDGSKLDPEESRPSFSTRRSQRSWTRFRSWSLLYT